MHICPIIILLYQKKEQIVVLLPRVSKATVYPYFGEPNTGGLGVCLSIKLNHGINLFIEVSY